jgi:hypothetical protein
MTTNPPEPAENPSSYAEHGYDDRQPDGMDAADARAVASRNPQDDDGDSISDVDRVEGDTRSQPPRPGS